MYTRYGRSYSSNRMALRVTRLAIRCPEFMRFSQRNELTAKICGSLVLWFCQRVFFFYLWGYLKGKVNESNPHTLDKEEHSKCYWNYRSRRFAYGEPDNTRTKLFDSQGPHYQHLLQKCAIILQKLNETKPLLISSSQRAGFKWKILNMYIYI
jgi:hypothetical protein